MFKPGLGAELGIFSAALPKCILRATLSRLLWAVGFASLLTLTALAWVYPEHRDIALLALQRLDPTQRVSLDKLWSAARTGYETRLCGQIADTAQGEKANVYRLRRVDRYRRGSLMFRARHARNRA